MKQNSRQKTNSTSPWSNRRPHGRSLAPLWSNLSSFEGKFAVLKKVPVTLLGLFGASSSNSGALAVIQRRHSELAPGELFPPCPPFVTPLATPQTTFPITIGTMPVLRFARLALRLIRLLLSVLMCLVFTRD